MSENAIFKVVVRQKLEQYKEEIVGYFDDLKEAQDFMEIVIAHFKKVSASITYYEDAESEDNQ